MKLDDYSNEVTQAQMQEFANSLRKAVASELSVVIVSGSISDELGNAVGCAMSFESRIHQSEHKAQLDATFALLKTAATLIDRLSAGVIKVRLHSPAGVMPVDAGDIREFISRST